MTSVGSDQFDDEVELPSRGHDVVGLGPARDRVGRLLGRARGLDPHHRLLVAEPERVRDCDDLEDPLRRQPSVARADRRLRDPHTRGDRAERLASVRLQCLDDPAVELVGAARRRHRAALRAAGRNPERLDVFTAHRARFLPLSRAFRQCDRAGTALRAGSSAERAMGALDRAHRRFAGIAEYGPVAGCEQLRLEGPQPAGRLEVEPLSQVAIEAIGKGSVKWLDTATPPSVVSTSPAMSVRSRVSRKATCPAYGPTPRSPRGCRRDRRARGARRASSPAPARSPGACRRRRSPPGWMRASSSGIATCTWPSSRPRSSSSEPTWSPWPWATAMRRIGAPASCAASISAPPAARDGRVDEREPVVLAHEKRVNEAQPRELDQVRGDLTHVRCRRNLRASPARGGSKQMMLAFVASSVLPDLTPDAPRRDACGVPSLVKELCVAWIRSARARLESRARRKPGARPRAGTRRRRPPRRVRRVDGAGAVRSRLPGRLMHEGLDVGVGDWVGLSRRADPHGPAAPQRHRAERGRPDRRPPRRSPRTSTSRSSSRRSARTSSRAASSAISSRSGRAAPPPRSCSRRPTASTTRGSSSRRSRRSRSASPSTSSPP